MDRMDSFDAKSPAELCDKLRANDVYVPPRGLGQTTAGCEIWVVCRFLSALSETNLLEYPLRVEHRDRPDIRAPAESCAIRTSLAATIVETATSA